MATMHVYQLNEDAGPHKMRGEDEDGNQINESMEPGDKVKSLKPLDRLHPNKFTRLTGKKEKVNDRGPLTEPVRPSRVRPNQGDEFEEDDEEFTPPETFDPDVDHETDEDEEDDLKAKAKAKAKAGKVPAKKGKKSAVHDDSEEPEVDEDGDEDEGMEKFGQDVTDDFDGTQEHDLKVFSKGKGRHAEFFVFDADDIETPKNDKPLTKAKAAQFIRDYKG